MHRFSPLSFIFVFIFLVGCNKPLPTLDQVDLNAWKEDKNGCLNKRTGMGELILKQKEVLLALNEKQIVDILGKPDQNELYKRNQKFYSYFISPAPTCNEGVTSSKILVIRFNAMGLAKEVNLE